MGKTYKLEPIGFHMGLDKLVYVPIRHPFRRHCEQVYIHLHSQ